MCLSISLMGATTGAGTCQLFRSTCVHPRFFVDFVLCVVFCTLLFVLVYLIIVLPVLIRSYTSDYFHIDMEIMVSMLKSPTNYGFHELFY